MSAGAGRIRCRPEDFFVDEVVPPRHEQEGEHVHVRIEKRGLSTDEAVRRVAAHAGIPTSRIGVCGKKDVHAVTRQWLSLQHADRVRVEELAHEDLRVIETVRLPRKLRLGRFLGNRFRIRLRDVARERIEPYRAALARLETHGLPNAFGPQRFGATGGNAERGRRLLRGELRLPRRKAAFFLSALQSELFQRVLARRRDSLDRALDGDLLWNHASGRLARVDDPIEAAERVARLELSPTGPLPGPDAPEPTGDALALERDALGTEAGLLEGDVARRLRAGGTRRPLRVPVTEIGSCVDADAHGPFLELRFRLPPGSYATTVLSEVTGGELDLAARPITE